MRPRLRAGRQPETVREQLAAVMARGRNVWSVGPDDSIHRHAYLMWVNEAERVLQDLFDEHHVTSALHGEFFWQIRNLQEGSPRGQELVNGEVERQVRRLESLDASLGRLLAFVGRAPGRLAITDTHVLLHFERPDQIDWPSIVGADPLRLILPLRVVEELDEKKYTARDDLAQRARSILAWLRKELAKSDRGVTQIRDGVSLEVFVDEEPRRRTLDADQEVLDTAIELAGLGQDLVLVTDDAGLELRARAQEVAVCRMDAKYLRRKPAAKS